MRQQNTKRTRRYWEDWWKDAREYAREHGNLLISRDYITPGGYRLGRWIERQRAIYNGCGYVQGSLSGDQIRALEHIGMVWKLENHYTWEEWLRQAEIYRNTHGDLLVPQSYVQGEYSLGSWIAEQRNKYDKKLLKGDQIRDLEQYGMVWSIRQNRTWDDWYQDAKTYYEEHGDLLVPAGYRTERGYPLGEWIFIQRDRYGKKSGKRYKEAERVAKLNALNMVWDLNELRNEKWEQMFHWVHEYLEENGKLPVWPLGIKAPDGRDMGSWIRSQRTDLGREKLDRDRIRRLKAIGIEKPMPLRKEFRFADHVAEY